MTSESVALPDEVATMALGAWLANRILPGDVLLLSGELGAGKTALARAIVRTLLGEPELEVPSPSFALVQPYEGNGRIVLHADLYRLAAARELEELGLLDDPEAVLLVEWPERAPKLFSLARLVVRLRLGPGGEGRVAEIEGR